MDSEALAAGALAELDRALAAKPHADGDILSATAHHLGALRDVLATAQRRDGADARGRERLAQVNAIISVVLAGHFPIDAVPWDELAKARVWLAALVAAPAQAGR